MRISATGVAVSIVAVRQRRTDCPTGRPHFVITRSYLRLPIYDNDPNAGRLGRAFIAPDLGSERMTLSRCCHDLCNV